MNRLALFDCDGTLVDSQHSIITSMQRAFSGQGLVIPDANAVRSIIGLQLEEGIGRLADDPDPDQIDRIADGYREAFIDIHQNPDLVDALYDGVPEMLRHFEKEGWMLGIATGKSRRGLNTVLERFGLRHHFVTLKTADDGPGKPDPSIVREALAEAGASSDRCVVIGDTSYDMLMAKNAGAGAIGVIWGYHPVVELSRCGAHEIARTVAELPILAERVLKG